jgi:hypothetical protein
MSSPMITIWIVSFVTSEWFVNTYNLKQNRSTERLGIWIGMLQVGTKSVSKSMRIRHNTNRNVVHRTCIWSLVVTAQLECMIKICQYMVTIVQSSSKPLSTWCIYMAGIVEWLLTSISDVICTIWGPCHDVDKILVLLVHCAMYVGTNMNCVIWL